MLKVTVFKGHLRGEKVWVVSRREGGKRKRSYFTGKAAAEAEASRLRGQLETAGEAWFSLPAAERDALMQLYWDAKKKGLDLRKLITEAEDKPQKSDGPALDTVIDELIKAKENSGRSDDYTGTLELILDDFAKGREKLPIGKIVLSDVEKFLDSKSIQSRSTLRARLSTLFRFSVRRGYRLDNPCSRLETVKVPRKPPEIFTVEKTKKALEWLRANARHALPWFILSTFCGLRPEEAEKTRREDIHIDEGWIKIEAQTTKVRQRRVVYPKLEAVLMLSDALKDGRLPLHPLARRRVIRQLREVLGYEKWPKDVTRHTAASYWLADSRSAADIAESLGNSERVLKRDYQALVTTEQAKEFWKLA